MGTPEVPELPSVGFYDRLTNAMQAWERRHGRVGQRGNQAQLITKMQERFGENAPAQAALSQWLRRETQPGPDAAFMLAYALEVRPEWLSLGLGPMHNKTDRPLVIDDSVDNFLPDTRPAQKKRRGTGS
jgi:hypothetical protein